MYDHDKHQESCDDSAIAIVGMSCRFPGAASVSQYWHNLMVGVENIQSKTDADGRVHASAELAGIEDFDYSFFGFSFKEAQLLDPQHRLLLECAWEVFEDASLHISRGSTGIFCGAGPSSYFINNIHGLANQDVSCSLYQSSDALARFMATDKEFLASRIAYKLNCTGPAVNVQAACATSMFAIQAAIQALLLGDCDVAVAGAAAVSVPQSIPYYFEPGMPFSADGHCRPFDAKASGTIFGSGAALVAFKRLSDALVDGDYIHAVVRSVATNNDGAHRAGMLAPSVAGQARVIQEALDAAGISPEQISYVEAHGTATPVGDPIEIKALANVFANRDRAQTCYLGSVKGNIGHLGWASGMAGLIKAVLISRHKVIPPTLNFEKYNPQLYIEETPFAINQQPVTLNEPRVIIGVSSFGLGGNNSHLIVETAPLRQAAAPPPTDPEQLWLIPLSARDQSGLHQLCNAYQSFLDTQNDENFLSFVTNLRYARSFLEQREFVIARNRQETMEKLAKLSVGDRPVLNGPPRIGVMFSGQGGEHQEMGRELYTCEAIFKAELDKFDVVCEEVFGAPAASLLFDPGFNKRIAQDISCSQPMTFALQVAMARLFLSHGNSPIALFGHSLGEYAAACIAGVFSAEQGFRILVERGRLLESLGDVGAMLVLEANEECVLRLIETAGENLSIAALNSLSNTVVSGPIKAVEQLMKLAIAAQISATRLNISRPGHSFLLDPLLDRFESYLERFEMSPPVAPLISSLTGKSAGDEVATARYWRRQLRETVDFKSCVATVIDLNCTHLIEIGPKAALTGLILNNLSGECLSVLPIARGAQRDHLQYLTVLGELFCAGANLCFNTVKGRIPVLDGLPTYPFQRVRCWIEAPGPAHRMTDSSYQIVWRSLKLDRMDSRVVERVLLLAPKEAHNSTETEKLKSAFTYFHRLELDNLMGEKVSSSQAQAIAMSAFDLLWKKHTTGLDRVYVDLRQLVTNNIPTAVATCALVLNLLRSMAAAYTRRPQLCLLFSTACGRGKDTRLSEVASSVVGMLRSILVEEPQLKVSVINFMRDRPYLGCEEAGPIELIPLTGELIVSINQAQAYVPRLERLMICEDFDNFFPSGQSYILLGGAGGIGIKLIQSLCSDQVRSIYVIGRSAKPTQALRNLMARYSFIRYLNLDLSTDQGRNDCALWLRSASIDKVTIFNLAVDLSDKLFGAVSRQDLTRSFDSKCTSILCLYQLLSNQGATIELILNFSSATAILGNGGQSAYGAASAFLDAAHVVLFPRASKVLTINWGVWGDAGKLQCDPKRIQVLKASGLSSHSSRDGLEFIKHLLNSLSCAVAFMNIQPNILRDKSPACA